MSMSPLAEAIAKEVHSLRVKSGLKRRKLDKRAQELLAAKNARNARNARKRKRRKQGPTAIYGEKPWNKLHPEKEMRLFLCASVRNRLRELENAEYEARYGK